jgi:hypothetical protein
VFESLCAHEVRVHRHVACRCLLHLRSKTDSSNTAPPNRGHIKATADTRADQMDDSGRFDNPAEHGP